VGVLAWIMMVRRLSCLLVLGVLACCSNEDPDEPHQAAAVQPQAEAATGQDQEGAEAPGQAVELHDPLRVGLHRKYRLMTIGAGQFTPQYWDCAYRITATEEIKGRTYYKQEMDMGGCPLREDYIAYEREDEGGRHTILGSDESRTEFFKAPLRIEPGVPWTVSAPLEEGTMEFEYEMTGIETLELFGVTYPDCLKVKVTSPRMTGVTYYCPGVGEVKNVYDYEGGTMVYMLKPLGDDGNADADEP